MLKTPFATSRIACGGGGSGGDRSRPKMTSKPDQRQQEEEAARMLLATRLREAREYLGLSQGQVAQHLGLSRSALSNIETGQRKVEVVELTRLATLYKRPVAYFAAEPAAPGDALPPDVELLARKASKLTPK